MTCSVERIVVDTREIFRLQNGLVRADVIPSLGARIWELWDVRRGIQWIWHAESAELRPVAAGDGYDDNWVGGWEELFPNDAAGIFDGRSLPDHGEWWSSSWACGIIENGPAQCVIRLSLATSAIGTQCQKTVEIRSGEASVRIHYRIVNRESRGIHFLLKQHLAVAIAPGDRLELPGGTVTPVDLSFSTQAGSPGPFTWPFANDRMGDRIDLSIVPSPITQAREFVYVAQIPDGWCGVRREVTGASLRMHYSLADFPYTWLFLTYGGWRNHFTAVLEPCTNMPKDLETARQAGACAHLEPGQKLECSVRVDLA